MISSSTAFSLLLLALFFGVNTISAFSGIPSTLSTRKISIQQNNHETSSSSSFKLYATKAAIDTYLEDSNYNQFMMKESKAVLVDCCAKWCGPCKLIDPFLVQAADKYAQDLKIVKFDVEAQDCGAVKMEFLLQDVMPQALPALIFFRNGQAISMKTGALSLKELFDFIETNLVDADAHVVVKTSGGAKVASAGSGSSKGKISLGAGGKDDYML